MREQGTASTGADQRPVRSITPRRTGPSGLLIALAALPFLGFLVGAIFFNRVTPFIFGFPRLLAWLLLWIVLTSVVMATIYRLDPENAVEEEVNQ
jgi:uncharacterized membrane protein